MLCVGGLGGIGLGLGPGGQPINANRLNSGGNMGSMGPAGPLPFVMLSKKYFLQRLYHIFMSDIWSLQICLFRQVLLQENPVHVY